MLYKDADQAASLGSALQDDGGIGRALSSLARDVIGIELGQRTDKLQEFDCVQVIALQRRVLEIHRLQFLCPCHHIISFSALSHHVISFSAHVIT